MAIMRYETPNVTKIDFEDNIFVTAGFDSYKNKEAKEYIESQGGIVKDSVTKAANYLIYECGQEETTKYRKALELVQEKGLDIVIISSYSFMRLITMHYETPGITEIDFENNIFVTTELGSDKYSTEQYIESRGGIIKRSITKNTNYLIYEKGKYPTKEYKKALSLVQEKGQDIIILSKKSFETLIAMTYEMPNVSEIVFPGKQFVVTASIQFDRWAYADDFRTYITKYGGSVAESVTKDTDYLIYGDGNWMTEEYRKALAIAKEDDPGIVILPFSTFLSFCHRFCNIEFGSYYTEEDGSHKPLQWSILKRDGNNALLLSVNGLDLKSYDYNANCYSPAAWETCTLRRWLNGDFYNAAFSDEEKSRIQSTRVINADNPRYSTSGGKDTDDKVFLLSIDEAKEYLTQFERLTSLTPFAMKQGAREMHCGHYEWWLRSPGSNPLDAASVYYTGSLNVRGNHVVWAKLAVCPAMWVELE